MDPSGVWGGDKRGVDQRSSRARIEATWTILMNLGAAHSPSSEARVVVLKEIPSDEHELSHESARIRTCMPEDVHA